MKVKQVLIWIAGIVVLLALVWGMGFFELAYTKFFSPKFQDVQRNVFENTKSYSHGKIQALTKHYSEWSKSEGIDRKAIEEIIRMEFANFDETHIDNLKLRQFLISIRGF